MRLFFMEKTVLGGKTLYLAPFPHIEKADTTVPALTPLALYLLLPVCLGNRNNLAPQH